MRHNTRKFKSNNSRHNIRSSSIRDIIGDRRFNDQFSHVNTHGTEGIKKVKRMKVGHAEADDLPNLGRNASSVQFEAMEDPGRCCGDVAAKTSEYAFFKRIKQNLCSSVLVHRKYLANQLDNVQQNDHFTREEIPNVQKEITKYGRSSYPVVKERDDAQNSFLSPPCCGSKNSEVNNAFGAGGTNAQKVRPSEYNWLSPSVGSKTKTSVGDKGVFSAKREKLRQWVAGNSLCEANEISSKGFDLVSVLMSRILPKDQENNCQRDPLLCQVETESKCKLPSFSEPEAATLIKGRESNKRKWTESHHISYLDDGFSRSTGRLLDTNLLELVPLGSESCSTGHAPKCKLPSFFESEAATLIKGREAYKRKWNESHHISYLDDGFSRPTGGLLHMDLLEWDPMGTESCSVGHAPKSRYNHSHTEGGFRIPNFAIKSILSSDEPLPRYEYSHFKQFEESDLDDGFSRSTGRPMDTNILEWDPVGTESCSTGHVPKSSSQYNHTHTEGGFRIPYFANESFISFNEPLPRYESSNFKELEESNLDDGFSRSTGRPVDTNILEWDPMGTESCSTGHAPKSSSQYNHTHTEGGFRIPYFANESILSFDEPLPRYESSDFKELEESDLDDGFSRSTGRLVDTDLLEWYPMGSESCSTGHAPKSSFQYNHTHTEGGFRIPNIAIESILSFPRYESSNFKELEASDFHNGPKLLEQPRALLLGWENNTDKDEFQLSALDSQTDFNTFSTSEDDGYQLCLPDRFMSSPPSSPNTFSNSPYYLLDGLVTPYIDRHLKEEHCLASSTLPVEDRRINIPPRDYTWCLNESLNEKEHRGSESFMLVIQSPGNNLLRSLNTDLHSFVVNDESKDDLWEGRMKDYHSSSYVDDHFGYPLLLHDSSKNE